MHFPWHKPRILGTPMAMETPQLRLGPAAAGLRLLKPKDWDEALELCAQAERVVESVVKESSISQELTNEHELTS